MTYKILSLALLATVVYATPLELTARDDCKPCAPEGATGSDPPEISGDLSSLYLDVLASVKDVHFKKREARSNVARADEFCCVLDCVNVQNLNIPMCYDKFTTNYAFPDGSYGSLTTGEYTQGGTVVNLINGTFKKSDGETGDIYSTNPAAKLNTATLSIPPQWTSEGVGSAIPASELASNMPNTAQSSPLSQPNAATTNSAPSQTNAPTTGLAATGSQNVVAASSSMAAAGHVGLDLSASFGMSLFSALMYAIYAL
jgi:hypothetical protein